MYLSKAVLVVAAAALASTAAFAGHSGSTTKTIHQPSFALKLKSEAFVQGNGDSTPLTQYSYTPIDSGTTLNCTRVCTVSANVSSQVQTAGADWAIVIAVDGSYAESQYQGVQSGPSSFVVGNVQTAVGSLAIGHHTVQTLLYTESASATYQYYSMHYAVHQ
ncbi:MAG TPA: hypothetical protein VHT03_02915 [Rhizomicrobium sp.]|jgi:hypothetical protein|nr:hypothetical protein [Rhizomicrobium sp.]